MQRGAQSLLGLLGSEMNATRRWGCKFYECLCRCLCCAVPLLHCKRACLIEPDHLGLLAAICFLLSCMLCHAAIICSCAGCY